jgi:HPt (histidine-containing phosphotransfer) domain-containing protein
MIKLDLTYLESISGGDKAFIADMLNMFLTNTFPEMVQLKEQAEQGQWEQMGGIAHKMKAPIQMLGVADVSTLVLELEQMGKTRTNTDQALEKIAKLKVYVEQMEEEINRYLQQ